MKKKLLRMMVIVAVALIGSYNVYTTNRSDHFCDLLLKNIEAFALPGDEIGPAPGGSNGCGYGLTYGGVGIIRACESCTYQFFVESISSVGKC